MTSLRASALIFVLIFPSVIFGQRISIDADVGAGIPLSKSVQDPGPSASPLLETANIERPGFVAGPVVQLNLGTQFSIGAEIFYRPVRYRRQETFPNSISIESITAYSMEVPVMGQFRFGSGKIQPIAGAGFVVYDRLWGSVDSGSILSTNQRTHVRLSYRPDDSSSGPPFVASAGFSWRYSRFRLNPQLRYTRWSGNHTRSLNQWDILLEVTMPVFRHD